MTVIDAVAAATADGHVRGMRATRANKVWRVVVDGRVGTGSTFEAARIAAGVAS